METAAKQLSGSKAAGDEDDSLNLKLLADIRNVWPEDGTEKIQTPVLIERLRKLEESPWAKQELSPHKLARMLRPFNVKPTQFREGSEGGLRGYHREALDSATSRYLTFSTATDAKALRDKELV